MSDGPTRMRSVTRLLSIAVVLGALAAVAAVPTASAVGDADAPMDRTFPDVEPTSAFRPAIDWLADAAVTGGYADGGFHPGDAITRQAMAAFLHRYAQATTGGTDPGFADVPPSHPFAPEIWWMAETGVTGGYPDGGFHPSSPITRQAMAAFLYRYAQAAPGAPDPGFTDVPTTHAFADAIWWMAESGITGGYPDGGFHPNGPITRQAMAAFMHRMAGEPAVGQPGLNRVDTDVADIIDGDDAVSGVANGDGTGELVLASDTTPLPIVGQILVLDAIAAVPDGAFGLITTVTPGPGGVTVTYGPAAVESAVPDADIVIAQELFSDSGSAASMSSRNGGIVNLTGSSCDGSFTAGVDIAASAALDFRAGWGPSASDRVFRLALNVQSSATATASASLNADCTMDIDLDAFIPQLYLPAVPLPGPLPPLQPKLEWNAMLQGTGGADLHFTGTASFSGSFGAEYINGHAGLINRTEVTGTASVTAGLPTGTAHAFVGPRISFDYVGRLSGWVEAGPFIEGESSSVNGSHWVIRGGLEAAAQLNADLWLLGAYTWTSARYPLMHQLLASGGSPPSDNQIVSNTGIGDLADAPVIVDGVSANGQFVLYHSTASNLPGGNGALHYWLKDSQDPAALHMVPELDGVATSVAPILTDDGSEIIFQSLGGFVDGPTGVSAVYAISTQTGAIDWVSEVPSGVVAGPVVGGETLIAADRGGRYLLVRVLEQLSGACRPSYATGLTDCFLGHYLRIDRWTGEVEDVWRGTQTLPGYLGGVTNTDRTATIDFTGRFAVVSANLGHLYGQARTVSHYGVPDRKGVLLIDMVAGKVYVATDAGPTTPANGDIDGASHISDDGRYVVYSSTSTNLGVADINGVADIYVVDIFTNEFLRPSIDGDGTHREGASTDPTISANGAYITYKTSDPTSEGLVGSGAYVYDLVAGTTCEVAVGAGGATPNQPISEAVIASEGYYLVFTSSATNLMPFPTSQSQAFRVLNRCI